MKDFDVVNEFLNKLEAEFAFKKIPTLNPMNEYLDYFNRPELSYSNRIIVTGTAGKGTTCRSVEKILNDNNISTLTLYSPHIISPLERIRINGKLISRELFSEVILEIKLVYEKIKTRISYYECLVLAGILTGKKLNCDILVAEVGIGGDFDATNAIKGDRISAITFIDLDHVNILGNSKELIAEKKLGIVTKDTKYFCSYETDLKEFFIEKSIVKPEFFEFKDNKNEQLAMRISSQILGFEVSKIPNIKLPCRFEKVKNNLILDGAHSIARFNDICEKIKNYDNSNKKRIGIIGMVKGHDFKDLNKIISIFDEVIWTKINFIRPYYSTEELKNYFNLGRREENIENIFSEIDKNQQNNYFVIGSFYLAGEFRKKIISKEYIEKTSNEFMN